MRNSLLFILIASLWGIMMIFVGCDDTKEFEDLNVTAVEALIVPIDNSRIDLQSSGNVLLNGKRLRRKMVIALCIMMCCLTKRKGISLLRSIFKLLTTRV